MKKSRRDAIAAFKAQSKPVPSAKPQPKPAKSYQEIPFGLVSGTAIVHPDGTIEVANRQARARVLDVHYFDGRMRKSVAGRTLAAAATGGVSLLASNNAGQITCTIVTDQWTHTFTSKENGPCETLNGLALQAIATR